MAPFPENTQEILNWSGPKLVPSQCRYQSQQYSKSLFEIRPEIFYLCWTQKPKTIKPSCCGLCESQFYSTKPLPSVDFSDRNCFFGISLFSGKRRYSGGTEWYYILTQKSYLYINYSNFTHVNEAVILLYDLLQSCNRKVSCLWHLCGNGTDNST